MSALSVTPLVAGRGAPLARRNPLAKLAAVSVLTLGLVAAVDPLTPALVLAAELAVLPLAGVPAGQLLRRAWPLLAGAGGLVVVNAVFAASGPGPLLVDLGPVQVGAAAAMAGLAIGVRALAIALPGVVLLASTDPVDLADALVQQAKVPPRFAYGALAALRLLPLLAEDWQAHARARRARGVEAGRNPVARLRGFAAQVFALLVAAIRRGTRLATAMDARGFDTAAGRTCARTQRLVAADGWLVVGAGAVVVLATAASVAAGTWRPLFG